MAGRLLRRDRAEARAGVRAPTPHIPGHRRWPAGAGRRPDLAAGDDQCQAAGVAHPRPARPVARTQARLSAELRRRDREQSRSAHPPGFAASDRAHDGACDRPAAIDAAARELRGRAVGVVGAGGVRHRRTQPCDPRLHGLVRARLFARRLAAGLARGSPAGCAQCRALRSGGRSALRARARQRVRRGHLAVRRRSRRAPRPGRAGRSHGDGHGAPGGRPRAPHLDHLRLRLARDRGPDHRGGAGLFRRRAELRHADDGGRRVQPGAVVAALVRRQPGADRRLAGDPRAHRRLSRHLAGGRHARRGGRPHRGPRRRVRPARARGPGRRAPGRLRDARSGPGRDSARRAHPDRWHARRRQEHGVPGARGHVALGRRDHPPTAPRRDDVHAATAVSAARHAARRRELSGRA